MNNKEEENNEEDENKDDNNNIRRYIANNDEGKNGDQRKGIGDRATKCNVGPNDPNYKFLNVSADRSNGVCTHVNSAKEPKEGALHNGERMGSIRQVVLENERKRTNNDQKPTK